MEAITVIRDDELLLGIEPSGCRWGAMGVVLDPRALTRYAGPVAEKRRRLRPLEAH